MQQTPPQKQNTPKQDTDYGNAGNQSYDEWKKRTMEAIEHHDASTEKLAKLMLNMLESAMPPTGTKLTPDDLANIKAMKDGGREGIQDAYLAEHLPDPFPQKAVAKRDTTKNR